MSYHQQSTFASDCFYFALRISNQASPSKRVGLMLGWEVSELASLEPLYLVLEMPGQIAPYAVGVDQSWECLWRSVEFAKGLDHSGLLALAIT